MYQRTKVTIITVTYNAQDCLEQTILSVINQTYPNIEFIIIDGDSSDKTIDIIKKYESHIDLWISEKDQGIYDAMNKGIEFANGEWINFMNAGDLFADKDTISKVFDKDYLSYDYIYGDRINKDDVGFFYEKAYPFFLQKKQNCPWKGICHQSTFVRKAMAQRHKYSLKYKYAGDYEMMYNIYKDGGAFLYRPIAVAIYNQTEGFSITGFRKSIIENAMLLGIPLNCKFKIWLEWMCLKNKINTYIKKHFHIRIKRKKTIINIQP